MISGLTLSTVSGANATAGTHDITASGGIASNYAITHVDGILKVDKAFFTITANDFSKVYDQMPYHGGNGVNYGEFLYGEDTSVLKGELIYVGSSQGAVQAGKYLIQPSGYSADNYKISYVKGLLIITLPLSMDSGLFHKTTADLPISANSQSKLVESQHLAGFSPVEQPLVGQPGASFSRGGMIVALTYDVVGDRASLTVGDRSGVFTDSVSAGFGYKHFANCNCGLLVAWGTSRGNYRWCDRGWCLADQRTGINMQYN